MAERFSIEIDCPPGRPRPGELIFNVLAGTGLVLGDFEEPTKLFGNWMWVLRDDAGKDEVYTAAKPKLKAKIEQLYHNNVIRYGSW